MITKKRWIATAFLFYFFQIVNPIMPILFIGAIFENCFMKVADGLQALWFLYKKVFRLDKLQDYLKEQRDELTRKGKW